MIEYIVYSNDGSRFSATAGEEQEIRDMLGFITDKALAGKIMTIWAKNEYLSPVSEDILQIHFTDLKKLKEVV